MTLQEQLKQCFSELIAEYTRIKINQERLYSCRVERKEQEDKLTTAPHITLDGACKKIDELNNKIKFYSLQINGCIGIIVGNIRGLLVANGYDITANIPVVWGAVQDIRTLTFREDISEQKFKDGLKYIASKWFVTD